MKEIFFIIKEDLISGFCAQAIDEFIFTEAETISGLKNNIKEAIMCHFDSVDNIFVRFKT